MTLRYDQEPTLVGNLIDTDISVVSRAPYGVAAPFQYYNQAQLAKYMSTKLYISAVTDPSSSTVGFIGQVYVNTATMTYFVCTHISGLVYTWTINGGSGGGMVDSVTPGDNSITIGGTVTNPTVAVHVLQGAGDPTTSTVGVLGQLYINTTVNPDTNLNNVFILNSINGGNYQWTLMSPVMGTWDANTNYPDLVGGSFNEGDTYVVSIAGTTVLNGWTAFYTGDLLIFQSGVWNKTFTRALSVATNPPDNNLQVPVGTFAVAPPISTVGNQVLFMCGSIFVGIPNTTQWLNVAYNTLFDVVDPTTSTAGSLGQLFLNTASGQVFILASQVLFTYNWQAIQPGALSNTVDPTTSTAGVIGQIYVNTSANTFFILTSIVGITYNWTSAGSGVASVTAGDTSITIGGTGTNPTVAVNTLSGASDPGFATTGVVGQVYVNTTTNLFFICTSSSPGFTWVMSPAAPLLNIGNPTTSTVGVLGQIFLNITSQEFFVLTHIAGAVYTWVPVVNSVTAFDASISVTGTNNAQIQVNTLSGSANPTTSTVGVIGQIYINTTSFEYFICTNVAAIYTWKSNGLVNAPILWNAFTNTPTLTSSVGTTGQTYVVNLAGTTTLDGISSWNTGDFAIFNGSVWTKSKQYTANGIVYADASQNSVTDATNFGWVDSIGSMYAGSGCTATGTNAFAFGLNSAANGNYSAVFGSGCTVSNDSGFACGLNNTAGARAGLIGGNNSSAAGDSCVIASNGSTSTNSYNATIGGGLNSNNANFSAAVGGISALIDVNCNASVNIGGLNNVITNSAFGSIALGSYSFIQNNNCFMFNTSNSYIFSSADNQFIVNAIGGMGVSTVTPRTTFHVNGSVAVGYAGTAVSTTTAALNVAIIGVTDTTAARTITLSDTNKYAGVIFTVKDESGGAGTNNITVQPQSGNLDGVASKAINVNYGAMRIYTNGTNWFTY